jgi:N-acetylglucosaminyl-diphospho-decaprenol L-rhamnosyltransferase
MIVTGQADVMVVVVGYNSKDTLGACFTSLLNTDWGKITAAAYFVDNASADGSVAFVQEFDPRIQIIANKTNLGFCEACNQAVRASDSRYVYLLNPDTELAKDAIPKLVRFLDSQPNVGAAGNRLLNPDGSDQWSARRFPDAINGLFGRRSALTKHFPDSKLVRHYLYKDELARGEPFPVDWIPGSCTLIRREAYEQVGGLPADMHYWSDAVFCDRVRKQGWEIFTLPDAKLFHAEGTGTGRKEPALRRWLIEDFHRGALRFYSEHYGLRPGTFKHSLAQACLGVRARAMITAARLSP